MNSIKWQSDTSSISGDLDLDAFVFRNASVNAYISSKVGFKPFVIAGKGMGKTLLLHYKRQLCQNENPGSIILPNVHRNVDFVETVRLNIGKETLERLANFDFCKRFWLLALKLYIISGVGITSDNVKSLLNDNDAKNFKSLLDHILDGEAKSINFVINRILELSFNHFNNAVDTLSLYVGEVFDKIHSPVCVFIDQLDQAISADVHKSIWIPMQNALVDAAWDISNKSNKHVKIFLSIRKEAFSKINRQSGNSEALQAAVVQIEYSKADLREMMNHLASFYEEGKDLTTFFQGLHTFRNTTTNSSEDIFDFMFRYSVGRPRDFVIMCDGVSKLSFSKLTKSQKRDEMKKSICKTAGIIVPSLFAEQKMLLSCFSSIDDFDSFLIHLSKNVYTYNELVDICRLINKDNCSGDCQNCSAHNHPFCDLYNLGLLGVVEKSESDSRLIQNFKTPYEPLVLGLIRSEVYLIHPALREYISTLNSKYHLIKGILVGHQIPWNDDYDDYYVFDLIINDIVNNAAKEAYIKQFEKYLKYRTIQKKADLVPQISNISLTMYDKKRCQALDKFLNGGEIIMPEKINIFISYATDHTEETDEEVDSFRDLLRQSGFNAQHYRSLLVRNQNFNALMQEEIDKADKVIVVLSPTYKRKVENKEGGVWIEFDMIFSDLRVHPNKYIFTCFSEFDEKTMYPKILGSQYVVSNIRKRKYYDELVSLIVEESQYSDYVSEDIVRVTKKVTKPFLRDDD